MGMITIGDDGMTRTVPVRYYRCQYCGKAIKTTEEQVRLDFMDCSYPFEVIVHMKCVDGYLERRLK